MTFITFVFAVCVLIVFMALCDLYNHFAKTRLMRWCLARVYDVQAIWEVFFEHHKWTVDNIKRKDAAKWVKIEPVETPRQLPKNSPYTRTWEVTTLDAELLQYETKEVKQIE